MAIPVIVLSKRNYGGLLKLECPTSQSLTLLSTQDEKLGRLSLDWIVAW